MGSSVLYLGLYTIEIVCISFGQAYSNTLKYRSIHLFGHSKTDSLLLYVNYISDTLLWYHSQGIHVYGNKTFDNTTFFLT